MADEVGQAQMHFSGLPFDEACSFLRKVLRNWAADTKGLMNHSIFKDETDGIMDVGEMKANIMLAYRHLEDATMRIGKAIQARDGGKSVYDK